MEQRQQIYLEMALLFLLRLNALPMKNQWKKDMKKTKKKEKNENLTQTSQTQSHHEESKDTQTPLPNAPRDFQFFGLTDKAGRSKNEDTFVTIENLPDTPEFSYFAIFDGHGGNKASKYCERKVHAVLQKVQNLDSSIIGEALKQAFIITDKEYAKKNPSDGTTAIVATIDSKNVVTVANAGDSRAILYRNGQIFELSVDHKPDLPSERERIEKAGHVVTKQTFVEDGVRKTLYRVNNFLAVARSIGDFSGKEEQGGPEVQPITCVPDIKKNACCQRRYFNNGL